MRTTSKVRLVILPLVLCAGIFVFPTKALASGAPLSGLPPEVSSVPDSAPLRVTATDDETGEEAMYAGDRRDTWGVREPVALTFTDDDDGADEVGVYAVDAEISEPEPEPVSMPTPEPIELSEAESAISPDPEPFTPDGTGTVVDHVVSGSKEFYVVETADGNVFYLIVDHDREGNNVYFLNVVTEDDLFSLSGGQKPQTLDESAIPATVMPLEEPPAETPEPEPEPETPVKKSNTGTLIFILLAALGLGGGYYIKIIKPKRQRMIMDDDEDEDEEEYADDGSDYSGDAKDDGDYEFESDNEDSDTDEDSEELEDTEVVTGI